MELAGYATIVAAWTTMTYQKADPEQVRRFKEAARRLADEEDISFDEALRRIAKTPPQHKPSKRRKRDD